MLKLSSGSAQRASSLVHRLLAFSRQQTLQPCSTQVTTLVAGMEELLRRTIGPAITLSSRFASRCGLPSLIRPNWKAPCSTSASTLAMPCPQVG